MSLLQTLLYWAFQPTLLKYSINKFIQSIFFTGLDPSGNQWDTNSGRLSESDAEYVEVIHTDSEGLFSNGLKDAIGDVDFYPNGGSKQPGCGLSNSCSHIRAWELFAATLREDNELSGNSCSNFLQLSWNRCNGDTLAMGDHQFSKRG